MNKPGRIVWTIIVVAVAALLVSVAFGISQSTDSASQAEISFTGLVTKPLTFDLDKIKSMPSVTVTTELICVSGESFGTHDWTGVRLRDLLNETGVQETAVKVAFHATDGYETDLKIEDAMRDDVIVAYLEDGVAMSEITKLVVPGQWGYKWISGIDSIRLVDYNFMGNWEGRGYPDDATITAL
jgi:DMSO/TMAO reductase YedYZ molybdopterin-dependent catalytic subunit